MVAFTRPTPEELTAFLASYGIDEHDEFQAVEGGSVNSNFSIRIGSSRRFLRIYEEQDALGAVRELERVGELAARGVPTPTALVGSRTLARRPAALFPWVAGTIACQRSVTASRARAVGEALARFHLAGAGLDGGEGRFHTLALRERLTRIDASAFPVARLARALDELPPSSAAGGLVHGDLFRDNVLWEGERLAALLDFESMFHGAFVFDLAVTLLAWTYGDAFDPALVSALVSGYQTARPLDQGEKRALYTEARRAAVRFTITRITDYAMKNNPAKSWLRFLERLDALEAMGERGFLGLADIV